ncbi:unnamed protein product [Pylaiella littoralis]
MMESDENDSEQLEAVPSDMFDSGPSPVSALGGWATGAMFAVTKGVSSRVEGVSSRMSSRAKDMLASVGEDPGGSGGGSPPISNGSSRNGTGSMGVFNSNSSADGTLSGIADKPSLDESEVSRLVSSLNSSPQLAEKMVAMNKLSSVLGEGTGECSQAVLRSVAAALVAVINDAEHFDPFFGNACVACAQQLLEVQGAVFAAELVEAGAAQALMPLLHPRFELIRIESLAFLEALLAAQRGRVCTQVVGVPTGMQALVDLLDDRWDEVRHQAVSLLAAFLTEDGGVPPPVDLQNFVAFQDGFDKLFKAVDEIPEDDVSLRALAALTGALANNPLSRKLFVGGGHLLRLPALLTVLKPGDTSERPLIQPRQAATTSRRRWGWGGGGGRDKDRAHTRPTNVGDNDGGDHGSTASPSSGGGSGSGGQAAGMEGGGGGGGWSGEVPVARICAALSLVSALVGCKGPGVATAAAGAVSGEKHGLAAAAAAVAASEDRATVAAADDVRAAVGREGGLLEAVCELALASPFAPAGGGPTWMEYGLPEDCQRSAMEVLTALVAGQPGNQARLVRCKVRGAPMSVTVHGQKQLVSAEPRDVVDVFLELWLAASSAACGAVAGGVGAKGGGGQADVAADVAMLDRALDAFLVGNTRWCEAVFAGVSATHAAAAKLSWSYPDLSPALPHSNGGAATASNTRGSSSNRNSNSNSTSNRSGGEGAANGSSRPHGMSGQNGGRRSSGVSDSGAEDGGIAVAGIAAMSAVVKSALLCVRATSSSSSSSGPASSPGGSEANGGGGGGGGGGGRGGNEGEDPLAAALCLRLFRRVLQAGGADARAIAAGVGVPTEGARRRREEAAAKVRREPSTQHPGGEDDGQEGSSGEPGGPVARGRSFEDGDGGGEAFEGGVDGEGMGKVRCSPPLVPALEVAVRLLADGYSVAVMFQTDSLEPGDEEHPSPPSDLSHYLVSLGELVVTWLSPGGVGPALSRRLLASGSSWALLRSIGRVFRPESARRNRSPGKRRYGENRQNSAAAGAASIAGAGASAVSRPSEDPAIAYLHALVGVAVGSFVSCGEGGLASETLAAGVAKHVGLFEFCRVLDAASDWVSFAWPPPTVPRSLTGGGGCRSPVPAFWALAGDSTFSAGMVEIVQAAQATMIQQIVAGAAVKRTARPSSVGGGTPRPNTIHGETEESSPTSAAVGRGWSAESESVAAGGRDGGRGPEPCEALLRRQQARIEELERRLGLPASPSSANAPAAAAAAAVYALDGNRERPTLTI